MPRNDLLTLLDREAETLAGENNHSAAALMRAAAAEIRGVTLSEAVAHYVATVEKEMVPRLLAALKDADLRFG